MTTAEQMKQLADSKQQDKKQKALEASEREYLKAMSSINDRAASGNYVYYSKTPFSHELIKRLKKEGFKVERPGHVSTFSAIVSWEK